mmetsp:Transcript_11310/g.29429  ORF Transcript_11310/g.29429 Transcript_11310/m.29429 type:complete len:222 (+) Transcript_11310:3-668(+)
MPLQFPRLALNRFGAARARVVTAVSAKRPMGWHLESITQGFLKASRRSSGLFDLIPHQFVATCAVATFWRGAWYMMDAVFPEDPLTSGLLSLGVGFTSFMIGQSLLCPLLLTTVTSARYSPSARIFSMYTLGLSAILTWRGVWCINDVVSEHVSGQAIDRHLFWSGVISHAGAMIILVYLGRLSSVLAPPAKSALLSDTRLWFGEAQSLKWLDWNVVHFRR